MNQHTYIYIQIYIHNYTCILCVGIYAYIYIWYRGPGTHGCLLNLGFRTAWVIGAAGCDSACLQIVPVFRMFTYKTLR